MCAAPNINALRGISTSAPVGVPSKEDTKKKLIIEKGLQQLSLNLSREEKELAAQKLSDTQSNHDKIKVGDKEISVDQLAFDVASSLQSLESETSPEEEYFGWIYEAQEVITEMNTGGIEPHEIAHREDFLGNLDQREMDMRVIMALYAKSNTPEAKQRLAFMQVKLAKLMEIRSAVKASTKGPVEATLNPQTNDQDKETASEAIEYLGYCRNNFGNKDIYSDESYKLSIGCAQMLIGLAAAQALSAAQKQEKQRYEELLENQRQYLLLQRDIFLRNKDASLQRTQDLEIIQRRLAAHQEIMNLVKLATKPSSVNASEEEIERDQRTREVCAAVLEYRRRGMDVPEGILYKLGVKSFVPDYSASEDWLVQKSKNESKADVIRRINELTGRQSSGSRSISGDRRSFDSERYLYLKSRIKAMNSY